MRRIVEALTLTRLLAILAVVGVLAMAARAPLDTDTFWHLRAGEWQVAHRAHLQADPFSHTRPGAVWLNHSWLSQVTLYALYRLLGDAGLVLWTAGLAAAGMVLVFRQCPGDPLVRAFSVLLAAAAAAVFWSPRPQMASFALSAVVLFLLRRFQQGQGDRLWLIPPVMLVWANLHGGFAIGFLLLALGMLGELVHWAADGLLGGPSARGAPVPFPLQRLLRLGQVAAVSVLAVCVNPLGPRVLLVPFQTVSIRALQDFIQEWASPDFHRRETWPTIWLLLLTLVAAAASARRLNWRDAVLVSAATYMALLAGRNIPTFALAAAPVLAEHLNALLQERRIVLRWERLPRTGLYGALNWLLLVLLLGAGAYKFSLAVDPSAIEQARRASLPVGAVEFIEQTHPPQMLFNSYNWGGYLIWALRDYPVYVDGRTDLYTDSLLRTYIQVAFAQDGWQAALDEAGIQTVLVESGSPLAAVLAGSRDWSLVYQDAVARVFVREGQP